MTGMPDETVPVVGGQWIGLQAAIYATLTSNPDLVLLRLGKPTTPSAEAVEVARHFPTTLNPTLWIDYRPIILIPFQPFSGTGTGTGMPRKGSVVGASSTSTFPFANRSSWDIRRLIATTSPRQPSNSSAGMCVQAECDGRSPAFRFFPTAAYRREKLKIARDLADFSERIARSLQDRLEADLVSAADVVLARVETRASPGLAKAARQDYLVALTDLRDQIGIPDSAGTMEPMGEFTLPAYIPP